MVPADYSTIIKDEIMAVKIELKTSYREETGKNAMRRLRKTGQIPGIVFGRSGETTPVQFPTRDLEKILYSESGFNTIFKLSVGGSKKEEFPMVIVKEYQVDPVTHNFLHVSFYRVHLDRVIEVNVPVHTIGTSIGVKNEGGNLDMVMREIHVNTLPANIPESIEIDITDLNINDSIRIKDITFPEGVEVDLDPEAVVLAINPPRIVKEEGEDEEGEEGEEEATEAAEEEE